MLKAPKIIGDTWFNSKRLAGQDFMDHVVLYDFWTFSCVNCLRTLPYIRDWWERYQCKDFLIVGIHTPEFEFEKDPGNVEKAIMDLGIDWPVVLDNDHMNWNNFANHYWPAKYLADKNGNIVYTHFGEGHYSETEKIIHQLVFGHSVPLQEYLIEHDHDRYCFVATPELYLGYRRGSLSGPFGYERDKEKDYRIPENFPDNSFALKGKFYIAPEYIQMRDKDAAISLKFHATEVNLVMAPEGMPAKVDLIYNGKVPPQGILGADANKKSEVLIDKPRMYNLLKSDKELKGKLDIASVEGNIKAYAFTFSGCG